MRERWERCEYERDAMMDGREHDDKWSGNVEGWISGYL
jgi:hypothetical protein